MKTFLTSLFITLTLQSISQVAISYFPFQSLLALSSNTEKFFWADYKLETNTFITNLNMELSPKFNVKRTEAVNYYVGAGISFNPAYIAADQAPISGYFADIGVRIKLLEKYRNVQLVFELSPYLNASLGGGNLRTRLGLAYNFSKRNTTKSNTP